jgi:hypothetical protein
LLVVTDLDINLAFNLAFNFVRQVVSSFVLAVNFVKEAVSSSFKIHSMLYQRLIFTAPFITAFIEFIQLAFLHFIRHIVLSACLLISQLRSMLVVAIISPESTVIAFRIPMLVYYH